MFRRTLCTVSHRPGDGAEPWGWGGSRHLQQPRSLPPQPRPPPARSRVSKHPPGPRARAHVAARMQHGRSPCGSSTPTRTPGPPTPPRPCSTPRAGWPPRSPFATKVTSAPRRQWEKSSWNSEITSPSGGWRSAGRAATRCACLGWEGAAAGTKSLPGA